MVTMTVETSLMNETAVSDASMYFTFYCASYASAVLGVVILSVRLSVRHTRAL